MPSRLLYLALQVVCFARASWTNASIRSERPAPEWVRQRNNSTMWWVEYSRNVRAIERIDALKAPADVLVYGDSITAWSKPTNLSRLPGSRKYFDKWLGAPLVSEPLAIPGDEIAHVGWRLVVGKELPRKDPRHVILFVGINDIVHGLETADIIDRMDSLLDFVTTRLPSTKVLLQLLLPSHPDVPRVNDGYKKLVRKYREYGKKVRSSDCLSDLTRGSDAWYSLMVDQLHPNEAGQNKILRCWRRKLKKWGGLRPARACR